MRCLKAVEEAVKRFWLIDRRRGARPPRPGAAARGHRPGAASGRRLRRGARASGKVLRGVTGPPHQEEVPALL